MTKLNDDPLIELRELAIAVWRFDDDPCRPLVERLQAEYLAECGSAGGTEDDFLAWIDWLDLLRQSVDAHAERARRGKLIAKVIQDRAGDRPEIPLWYCRDGGPLDPNVATEEQRNAFLAVFDQDPDRAQEIAERFDATRKVDAKVDAALDRYLAAREVLGIGRGSKEEFSDWLGKQDLNLDDDDRRGLSFALTTQIWIEDTRIALGLDPDEDGDDDHEGRITVEVDGKPVQLPRYIVTPGGDSEDFGDSIHNTPQYATVRDHRLHADWMIRVGSIEAGRDQLLVNDELLRRAAGNQDAVIGELLAA